MALVRTTLTAPITASQLTFGVASTANQAFPAVGGAPVQMQPICVDDEVMFLVSCPAVNIVTVRMRGSDGTDAVPHDTGSSVVTTATPAQDFPSIVAGQMTLRPPSAPDITTYGQTSEVIAVPSEESVIFLAPPSAGSFTLGAPSLALNGITVTLTSQTAFAHVVSAPGLIFTAGGSGPFSTITFPAQVSASVQLIAQNGFWNATNASVTPVTFS